MLMRAKKENIKKATGVGAIKIKWRGMRNDGETDKDRRRRSREREMGGEGNSLVCLVSSPPPQEGFWEWGVG